MLETAGASFFLNLLGFILKLIPFTAVIRVHVTSLQYTLLSDDPHSPIVVLSPNPSRYHLEASVSHLRGRKTTFKHAFLTINNSLKLRPNHFDTFALNPGEMKQVDLIFPVEEPDAVKTGDFEVTFLDVYGRKAKAKGTFPIE
jgi:hypothetical protein